MKRVIIVVNKWWECDPVVSAMLNDNARPGAILGWPHHLQPPRRRLAKPSPKTPSPKPRAVFHLTKCTVEVWCISDLLEYLEDKAKYQSSSEQKIARLPLIFQGAPPDLVIAVGTAAMPAEVTENGSVVIGCGIFMHDGHPGGSNPDSKWNDGPFDKLLVSALSPAQFAAITKLDSAVIDRFLPAPLNPSWKARILSRYDYVALNTVNVTDYTEYDRKDAETRTAFAAIGALGKPMSLETTHGLIRAQSDAPFLFVSGIANRVGCIQDEVGPRPYSQNTAAANNAGIVVAWMLPNIDAQF